MAKLWQFLQGHQKTRIFCKSAKGGQGKIFKNRLKRGRHLKGPEAL